jgi:hypothetical protein
MYRDPHSRPAFLVRKALLRFWLRTVLAAALLAAGLAGGNAVLAQQAPVMRITETVEIDRAGNGKSSVTIKLPAGLYTELKKNSPNMAVLLRRMGLHQSWHEVRDVGGDFDDNASTVNIHWTTRGLARAVRDNLWEAPLGGDGNLETVSLRENEALFSTALTTPLGLSTGVVRVTTPAGSRDMQTLKGPERIAFRMPAPEAKEGTKVAVKVSLQAKPQAMICLAKVYGDPKFTNFWVARSVLENVGDQSIKDYRVRFRVAEYTSGWSPWSRTEQVVPGQMVADAYFPVFDLEKVSKLNGPRQAVVEMEYEYLGAGGQPVKETDSQQIQLLGRNQVLYSSLSADQAVDFHDRFDYGPTILAAFVTKDDPVIQQLAGWVSGQAGGAAASMGDEEAIKYLKALYDFLAANKIAYQTPPGGRVNGQFSQHVKYGRDVLQNRAGTCIDLAILFGSACEAVGLKPVLFLIPSHCFPAVVLPRSGKILAVESTMVGKADFDKALKAGAEEAMKAVTKQIPSYQVDIMQLREMGVYSLELPAVPTGVLKDWGIQPAPTQAADNPPAPEQRMPPRDERHADAGGGGENPAGYSIVGKWTGSAVINGQRLITYSAMKPDGTMGCAVTNEAGQVLSRDAGRYTYANGILSSQFDSGGWEKASITWVNPNQLIYRVVACGNPSLVGLRVTCRRLEQ